MGARRVTTSNNGKRKSLRPAITPEARENQIISGIVDLVERQIQEGTVSPSVQIHYLRLASSKERLERERLERENELLQAKVENLKSMQRSEEMYENALKAMKSYSGQSNEDDYDDDYEDDYDDEEYDYDRY